VEPGSTKAVAFARRRTVRIAAYIALAVLCAVLGNHYLRPGITVERVDDAEWGFRTLGANDAWLFRYRGGLVDCWMEKGPEKSPEIQQTLALSQDLKDLSAGFKYGLIFLKRSSHQGEATLELSHWAVIANGTMIGKTAVVRIPEENTRTGVAVGPQNGRQIAPAVLMMWAFESESVPWPQVRLMCGKPRQ
jgi:hypothetical protein